MSTLSTAFRLKPQQVFEYEYLVESSIPPDAVIAQMTLRDMERLTGHDFKLEIEDLAIEERQKEPPLTIAALQRMAVLRDQ